MPYINSTSRRLLAELTEPMTIGELNYVITMACLRYLKTNTKESYRHYNEIIGVLECAKLEMYRRKVVPYEEDRRHENGDVY